MKHSATMQNVKTVELTSMWANNIKQHMHSTIGSVAHASIPQTRPMPQWAAPPNNENTNNKSKHKQPIELMLHPQPLGEGHYIHTCNKMTYTLSELSEPYWSLLTCLVCPDVPWACKCLLTAHHEGHCILVCIASWCVPVSRCVLMCPKLTKEPTKAYQCLILSWCFLMCPSVCPELSQAYKTY